MMIDSTPEATASSTTYWISGLSTRGSISLGEALVAGRKRVPRPAAGKTALRTFCGIIKFRFAIADFHQAIEEYQKDSEPPRSLRVIGSKEYGKTSIVLTGVF